MSVDDEIILAGSIWWLIAYALAASIWWLISYALGAVLALIACKWL